MGNRQLFIANAVTYPDSILHTPLSGLDFTTVITPNHGGNARGNLPADTAGYGGNGDVSESKLGGTSGDEEVIKEDLFLGCTKA